MPPIRPRLSDRVLQTLRAHRLIEAGSRVIVAVSGGADSVALLYLLREVAPAVGFAVAGLAHLNHRLRGEAADRDEHFCRDLAGRLQIPVDVGVADVRSAAREHHESIEAAARRCRYGFLAEAAARANADRIAVGHTRDDQAETFLLKVLRGAGPRGLGGIYPKRGSIVRPLLEVGRSELRQYLRTLGAEYQEDETNLDLANPRNRIRHELLPYLAAHMSPSVAEVLARDADIAREDGHWLDRQAAEVSNAIVTLDGDMALSIDLRALQAQPAALARRVVFDALTRQADGRFIAFSHVQALLQLAAEPSGGPIDVPGQRAVRLKDRLLLIRRHGRAVATAGTNSFRYSLSIPGEVSIDEIGWAISADRGEGPLAAAGGSADAQVSVTVEGLTGSLAVRTRKPGDAFRPFGLLGHRKLQDFFTDRKVPRSQRDRVPLVVDADDRIIWVVGQAVSNDFRVTDRTKPVIILTAKYLGGPG